MRRDAQAESWRYCVCLKCTCDFLLFPREFLVLMTWRIADGVSSFYMHENRPHYTSCADTRSISYSYHQPLSPTARSMVPVVNV